jgi:hypothetical protein
MTNRKSAKSSTKIQNEPKSRQSEAHLTKEDWSRIIDIINDFAVMHYSCPEEVYVKLGIPRMTFENQLTKNPDLFSAYDLLKIKIAIESEKYAKSKNLGMSTVLAQSLTKLSPRWQNEDSQSNQTKYVVLEKY